MRLLALLACVGCLGAAGVAQDAGKTRIEIKGLVINSATGQPIGGALVELDAGPRPVATAPSQDPRGDQDLVSVSPVQMLPQAPQRAVTETTGSFLFSAFPSRSTRLKVSRRGYQSEQETDVAVVNVPYEDTRPVTVKLVPPGVIQGRVVNADGEPLPGLAVEAVRVQVRDGRNEARAFRSGLTNDLGEYRLWNLTPSSYYLKVVGRRGTYTTLTGTPQAGESEEAYGPLYFPNAPSPESAQAIRLNGGETFRADFKVEGQPAYRIRGVVANIVSNRRLAIRLLRGEDAVGNRATLNVTSGAFQVFDVTPGAYTLQIYSADTGPVLFGETEVSVQNRELTDVSLVLNGGLDVSAMVEGLSEERPFVTVTATPAAPARLPVVLPAVAAYPRFPNPDLTLKSLLPGKYDLTVTSGSELYVASVTSGDIDVLAEGLTIGTNSPPPIKIQLKEGAGAIDGTVDGLSPDTTAVVAVVHDSGRSVQTEISYAAADGKFHVGGLAPGLYSVYAWRPQQQIAFRDANALSRFSASAVSVSVQSGNRATVAVKLIEAQP